MCRRGSTRTKGSGLELGKHCQKGTNLEGMCAKVKISSNKESRQCKEIIDFGKKGRKAGKRRKRVKAVKDGIKQEGRKSVQSRKAQ